MRKGFRQCKLQLITCERSSVTRQVHHDHQKKLIDEVNSLNSYLLQFLKKQNR
jgi:hypothetical protein